MCMCMFMIYQLTKSIHKKKENCQVEIKKNYFRVMCTFLNNEEIFSIKNKSEKKVNE